MAEAPARDEILTESDAVNILEELTEAVGHAVLLGVMLSIKPVELEAISKMYQDPKERFYQIILAFLRQVEPPPTWRAIVNALRSPIVNLIPLAKRVEAAHFPDPTASRNPPTTSVKDVTPQLPAVFTSNQLPTTSAHRKKRAVSASFLPWTSIGTGSTASVALPAPGATPSLNRPKLSSEEDYLFVEQPSEDLFCPVTHSLLLQPHLTSCCGNHISQEAASSIQREGGACPLCNTHSWSTMLNKHLQRQVKSLRVFCRHDDRGCGWQGELVNFNSHIQSCPMKDAPFMTELLKLPLYGDGATEDRATDRDPSKQLQEMAEAPAGDNILTESDAVNILEELREAQNSAHLLGFMFRIEPMKVDAICQAYQNPKERLYQIILVFLRQAEPPPTWRAILNALKSPLVNLTALAKRVEAAHFPDPTASRDPPTTSVKDVTPQLPASICSSSSSNQPPYTSDIHKVEQEISHFKRRFYQLKRDCRDGLTKKKIPVPQVVDALTDLPADGFDEHKHFLSHLSVLYQASDHAELIGQLSFHMDYLSYHPLDYLGNEFDLVEVKGKMTIYKSDLQQFRKKTPLALFCRTQKRKRIKPTVEFREMVAEFDWPENVTLEDVEQFRQEYTPQYKLKECALMIAQICIG